MNHSAYLEKKAALDERSLNSRILDRVRRSIQPGWRVLDIGAGTGSMVDRFGEALTSGQYLGVDTDPVPLTFLREKLRAMGIRGATQISRVEDIESYTSERDWDLLLAHMFLDLVDPQIVLPLLLDRLRPGGLAYFSMIFDGHTQFFPFHPLDPQVCDAYHRSMNAAGRIGSETGSRILEIVQNRQEHPEFERYLVLDAAPSDWIVLARGSAYSPEESAVLEAMLDFLAGSVSEQELGGFRGWLECRRDQFAACTLGFRNRQLDILIEARR